MALDAKHRSSIYGKLVPLLGEEDANALMSEFPASEADELVTKQFLRAEIADFRAEFADLRTEFADLRTEFADLRADVSEALRRQTVTTVGLIVGATAVIEALTTLA